MKILKMRIINEEGAFSNKKVRKDQAKRRLENSNKNYQNEIISIK